MRAKGIGIRPVNDIYLSTFVALGKSSTDDWAPFFLVKLDQC